MFPTDRLPLAERFATLLATDGVVRGLIGPREAPRLWERHLLNCAVLAQEVPEGAAVCDIGSGAGLPGVVLAIARPDLRLTLVEPLLRRTTFLDEVVAELGLAVTVRRARAEALHGVERFDVVTSRAVAPLGRLLDWSMPLVAAHGSLVAMKGSNVAVEIEEAAAELRAWGCAPPQVLELGGGLIPSTTHAVRVAWADPSSVSWPPSARSSGGRGGKGGGGRAAAPRRRGMKSARRRGPSS
ncbi:16S rRNA (guanine(527)-N(7))-methyltransferase RsmG [Nocardioides dongxiaopingii]|uniref:16S rRNA (guanine(527)-N(7))-methyltransferase RsmG n=1 Tax=Nocardioides dongxiaopingii TaxID=2576036 RepID=UPI001FE2CE00|nr:16S rRNA (guanine(527)-N(7))-methyltransferase RsmG [Nocardioides dongxiaopingii]